jgi:NADH-quinone oxidoreductase subunit N
MELYGVLLIILAVVNKRSKQSTESGTKYYILSSFASIMLLLGVALLYVTTSLTYYQDLFTFLNFFFSNSHTLEDKWGIYVSLSFIAVGFLFKLYSAPFHFWISDIYQGSANSAVIYFSTSSYFIYIYVFLKLYFAVLFNAVSFFQSFFIAIAVLTMISGAVGGLMQRSLKRVIAYSSVTATGYFLLILSCNSFSGLVSFFVFLITYVLTLFAVFVFISQPVLHGKSFISFFDDLENYYKINKLISFMLSAFFFSLGGIPPFIGFIGKFEMLGSLFFKGYLSAFLAFLIVSTVSFLYYARIVKVLYTKDINRFFFIENFSFFNSVVMVFCFFLLLVGFFFNGSLYLFSQLLVFNLISV